MLSSILKSSGWSQQYLATRLGVSFPTVNYWLNNKVTPRKSMQKRIRDLYIARDIPYEGPVYITLRPNSPFANVEIGDDILLFKTTEDGPDGYKVFGLKREDSDSESSSDPTTPNFLPANRNVSLTVANTSTTVAKGTQPAFRIYDRISRGTYARVMFILGNSIIAVIEDWGLGTS